ncbi:MAG: hypothetical protein ABIE55_01985 [Candidatus Aenigmatarchaeota archaeon]
MLNTEKIFLDMEGPVVNPKGDFAYVIHEKLSEETRTKFPGKAVDEFDGYDDKRYFDELRKSDPRHSTGTTPLLVTCIAAYDGKTDEEINYLAEKMVKHNLNPGAGALLEGAIEEFGVDNVYFVTNSNPPIGLNIAEIYGIPFKQVFTNGFQPKRPKSNLIEEIEQRSPLTALSKNKEELGQFLSDYLASCQSLTVAYDQSLKLGQIKTHLEYQRELFDKCSGKQGSALKRLFLTEEGIMGGHRKVDAMRSVTDDRGKLGFLGDSIVDAMALNYAGKGVSVNMTNKHALQFSDMNVATNNMSSLIPLFRNMAAGEIELDKGFDHKKISSFTPHNIQKIIESVIETNSETKNALKAIYVPI